MSHIKVGVIVKVRATNELGIVEKVLYNPYLPSFLSPPNYLVRMQNDASLKVFTKRKIKEY